MLCKTRGIVLHTLPYSDTYTIIYMYTEMFGRVSYLVTVVEADARRSRKPCSYRFRC